LAAAFLVFNPHPNPLEITLKHDNFCPDTKLLSHLTLFTIENIDLLTGLILEICELFKTIFLGTINDDMDCLLITFKHVLGSTDLVEISFANTVEKRENIFDFLQLF
jgi:hypothetical protein